MKVKLFWKENCPQCPSAKNLLKNHSNVEYYNIEETDGLAEAIYHGIMSTPSILLMDDELVVHSWAGEVPTKQEFEEWMSKCET
jgi:glutaredoxin